jgi:hypothetical protein
LRREAGCLLREFIFWGKQMKEKWAATFQRFLVLVNYGALLIGLFLVGIGRHLGWDPTLVALIAVALVAFLLTFVRIHIATGYWELIHTRSSQLNEADLRTARSGLASGFVWFIVLAALYIYFTVFVTFNRLNVPDLLILLYMADTLPSAVLAWREEGSVRGALLATAKRLVITILILGALFLLNFYVIRPWQHTWGATAAEATRAMPGDELVASPDLNATRAVSVNADPASIWPWLMQLGYKRGGFYSYDYLDNDGIPSTRMILTEYQDTKAGDRIPIGDGAFVQVVELEPERAMVLQFEEGPWGGNTWVFCLYPQPDGTTRLISRLRVRYQHGFPDILPWLMLDTGEIVMMRRCLLGIRERAEAYTQSQALAVP